MIEMKPYIIGGIAKNNGLKTKKTGNTGGDLNYLITPTLKFNLNSTPLSFNSWVLLMTIFFFYVKNLVEKFIQNGAKEEYIGVITPYKDHEEYIKKIMQNEVEVKSVDGFQGREKEIIIVSLVRANENEEIGFLNDIRRLNVAITRPKRKLIVIGDANTLKVNKTYEDLIEYVKKEGLYKTI
jgi:uncharacterized membrane-anchored protein YitT (DUF2179 family)